MQYTLAFRIAVWSSLLCIAPSAHADRLYLHNAASTPEGFQVLFDARDTDEKALLGLKSDHVTRVTVGGKPVSGTFSLESNKQPVAIAVLVAAHNSYTMTFDALSAEDEGNAVATPSTFDRVRQGLANMLRRLNVADARAYKYDERGHQPLTAWSANRDTVAKALEKAEKCPADECRDMMPPRLYGSVRHVLEDFGERIQWREDYPTRRMLVIVTDGRDEAVRRVQRLKGYLTRLAALARASGVSIHVVGYTEEETEPLAHTSQLSANTGGVYRYIEQEIRKQDLIPRLETLGDELAQSYTLSVKPSTPLAGTPSTKVGVELEHAGKRLTGVLADVSLTATGGGSQGQAAAPSGGGMTMDLWLLLATTLLAWLLILADATPNMLRKGLMWAMSNRGGEDDPTPPTGLHGRIHRANLNMQENLPIFAVLVLVVNVAGKAGDLSAMGAWVFFGARLGHALVYMAGVPVLRTVLWSVSLVGMGLVAAQAF